MLLSAAFGGGLQALRSFCQTTVMLVKLRVGTQLESLRKKVSYSFATQQLL